MMRFYAEKFVEADRSLTQLVLVANNPALKAFDPASLKHAQDQFAWLSRTLGELALPVSQELCDEFAIELAKNPPPSELIGYLTRLWDIMRRELRAVHFLALSTPEKSLFEPSAPLFGADFAAKFKTSGAFELDEAAKCMALGRPTAAVFHLMRILELGIAAFATCLGIPDPIKPAERNWGIILKKIKEEGIEKKWPTPADRMKGDGLLFKSLHASLDAAKNPWRNETMHVSGKYTDDEARHIFVAVEGLMKKLSARMDENGLPLA